MKKYILFIGVLVSVMAACKKADYLLYEDAARVQLADTATLNYTFIFQSSAIVRDTIYIPVNTIGDIASYDRPVKLEQVPEYDYTYVRDPVTNVITDTIATEKPFKAIAGTQYVAFDDPGMQSLMVVHAGLAKDSLPIILLRDASLKDNTYRLRVRLVANDTFALGETKAVERTLVFSDRLERFYSWRVDTYTAPAYIYFGKYSTGKHQFMYDVLKTNIDEDWYQAISGVGATTHYKNLLRDALLAFNADPANIASGKAPLRETSDPTSAVVTFPQ